MILLGVFIPSTFYNAFYQSLGRKRHYPMEGFLSTLILQNIFSIPTDAPLLTRFKQNFEVFIEQLFHLLVDFTEPICLLINSSLAQMFTFDTSGIELYITENNPKTLNALIGKLKAYYKDRPDIDPYSMDYALMPSHIASCPG